MCAALAAEGGTGEGATRRGRSTQRGQNLQRSWLEDPPPPYSVTDDYQEKKIGKRMERYAVRRPIVNDILIRLAGPGGQRLQPSVDAFADEQLHVCDRWWGPGSDVPNALDIPWGGEPLLWLNPPYSMMGKVVTKIKQDGAKGVLICPHWTTEPWYKEVKQIACRSYFYRQGTLMFEVPEGVMPGTKWPVWALFVDGAGAGQCPDEREKKITKAAGRRWRRKYKAVTLC